MFFTIDFDATTQNIIDTVDRITQDLVDGPILMDISKIFVEMCDPYVPYKTGNLAHSATPSMQGVTYYAPYAEDVYERNDSNFNREYHPLATGHWDKVMLANQEDEFFAKITDAIMQKAKTEGFKWS